MRQIGLIILGIAVLVWGILALALGSASLDIGSGSAGHDSATSPACLPASVDHSAALAGTRADVSPAPGTATANPATEISFLGVRPGAVAAVNVDGSRSGVHPGRLRAYSQGDGVSFVPASPFDAGERVTVAATVGGRRVTYAFSVDHPYATARTAGFGNPQAARADYQSFYTLPGAQAPILDVTTADRDPAAGDILTTNGPGAGQYGALIYDPQGRLVWFERLHGGEAAEDLNVQTFAGAPALTWWRGRVLDLGFGQGEDVVMDSSYRTVARVTGGNGLKADLHEFQIAPHDVAYITAYNPIRCNLRALGGRAGGAILDAAIQEIDMRTGLVRWEWHALDHVAASESEVQVPSDTTPWDWFHLNSIDAEPGGGLLISARSTWAAYQLQAGSGTILWRLGGNKSSFAMGAGTRLAWQHDGRVLPGGDVTLFDDGSNPPIHAQSRAVRIRLDIPRHRATLVRQYVHRDPPLLAASQGNAQTLPDGNVVVGFGGVPAISEFSAAGSLLFDAHEPFDMIFYRAYRHPWSARPATPPAVVASLNDTGEETIVHASWNGGTGVASWRVLAGRVPASLAPAVTIPAEGFETSLTLPKRFTYVAAQALDTRGRVLSVSASSRVVSYGAALAAAR
ncbi:MAG TPA: arylsulfotransferase family protein [Solirubrobacteraceae bacterium]|jgi:hypothetical protein|nr:arylsulfotransferase family protein [Solirubrobacteraceae bacterium]